MYGIKLTAVENHAGDYDDITNDYGCKDNDTDDDDRYCYYCLCVSTVLWNDAVRYFIITLLAFCHSCCCCCVASALDIHDNSNNDDKRNNKNNGNDNNENK